MPGYHVPSASEWQKILKDVPNSYSGAIIMEEVLKLSRAGKRGYRNGAILDGQDYI